MKNKKRLIIVLFIVVLLSLIMGAYLYNNKSNKEYYIKYTQLSDDFMFLAYDYYNEEKAHVAMFKYNLDKKYNYDIITEVYENKKMVDRHGTKISGTGKIYYKVIFDINNNKAYDRFFVISKNGHSGFNSGQIKLKNVNQIVSWGGSSPSVSNSDKIYTDNGEKAIIKDNKKHLIYNITGGYENHKQKVDKDLTFLPNEDIIKIYIQRSKKD